MIHIFKNGKKEFYWLSITKRRAFEQVSKSKEYPTKAKCIQSIRDEAKVFNSNRLFNLVDYTEGKVVSIATTKATDVHLPYFSTFLNIEGVANDKGKEIDFVLKTYFEV